MASGNCKTGIWTLVLLLLVRSSIGTVHAQTKPTLEYQVKAAFLFNFTRFVHWPATAYGSPETPFVIGIVGNDPFGAYLDELVSGESADGHRIVIRRYPNGGDLTGCQLVFISNAEPSMTKTMLLQSSHQNMLTVSDADDFIRTGGIIRFYKEENRVKMEIRLAAAKSAKLDISAKLLQVAKVK